jgi:NADH-quinone oxidoreductase subunit M
MTGIQLAFGLDGFSIVFIILTIFIFNICFFSLDVNAKEFSIFIQLLIILELLIILIFSVLDLFFFYFFFEASLIPMFFLVGF